MHFLDAQLSPLLWKLAVALLAAGITWVLNEQSKSVKLQRVVAIALPILRAAAAAAGITPDKVEAWVLARLPGFLAAHGLRVSAGAIAKLVSDVEAQVIANQNAPKTASPMAVPGPSQGTNASPVKPPG